MFFNSSKQKGLQDMMASLAARSAAASAAAESEMAQLSSSMQVCTVVVFFSSIGS